jgi:uncharacterized lipoprotein YmbA
MMVSANRLQTGFLVLALFATAQLVAGCFGRSPQTQYYAFTSQELVGDNSGDTIIQIGPFDIPNYLNRPQIVVREQGTSIKVLDFERWAEPLADAIPRRVSSELNNLMSSSLAFPFPAATDANANYKIRGRIENFEAGTDGNVILRLRWAVMQSDNSYALPPQSASYSATISPGAGAAVITDAMDGLLGEFAVELAEELKQLGIE